MAHFTNNKMRKMCISKESPSCLNNQNSQSFRENEVNSRKILHSGEFLGYNIAKMTGYISTKYFKENKSLGIFKKIWTQNLTEKKKEPGYKAFPFAFSFHITFK